MAARITITPEELRTASTNFSNKASEVREILEYLRSEVNRLESTWDGAAQDQFFITYEEMAKTLDQFPEVIDGLSSQLSAVAQTLEDTDQALADSLKG
jgi:WXG100 family type VII secretion target